MPYGYCIDVKHKRKINTEKKAKVVAAVKHRRRINTEEKTKVVAAVWGTDFIKFLATLAIVH